MPTRTKKSQSKSRARKSPAGKSGAGKNTIRKLDVFTHIWPKAFHEKLLQVTGHMRDMHRRSEGVPMMTNLEVRFQVMDKFPGYQQILSLASPPPDAVGSPEDWRELARLGNDGMAELCQKYPERFPSFLAAVPMRDPEGAVAEARRSIQQLSACGIQIPANVSGKSLDAPEFRPLFQEMEKLGKPIWIHPARTANIPDFSTEQHVALRNLVDFRLALRIERGAGAHRFLEDARRYARPEIHHPSCRWDGSLLRGSRRAPVGTS